MYGQRYEAHSVAMTSEPRTQGASEAARDVAYRRLAAVILSLDVATLAQDLREARLQAQETGDFAKAA
jgi:hypothetical protein